jgi:HK97 family phage prohead protease
MSEETKVMRRTFSAPLETDDEGRIVEGCIVPYGEAQKVSDGGAPYYEVFEPGAFAKQLRAADRIELRYEHGEELADSVGVGRSLVEQANMLFGSFRMHRSAFGDQALELVRAGVLPGFSIEFSDRFTHWRKNAAGAIVRSKCILHSVGLVRVPAYDTALVTAVRSRAELLPDVELPEIEAGQLDRLRAVGIEV